MALALWPLGLPQTLQQDGFSLQPPQNFIATPMEVGPRKTRRRDVVATYPVQGQIVVTSAQLDILWAFFRVTIADGSLPFEWVEPRTGDAAEFTFKEPFTVSDLGGGNSRISLSFEVTA
ncbi:hypothetical protein SAMN04488503_2293 [Humidesulfovibrio mexicanus]|uniref:Uncharacterized protein n=1 Tax=Humidesulfovibrio mexicanus TaxID=147047 RepID=A0A239AXR6_9BACT|nr:hypothetical protein [Humidesulfovibrio mexicanus]SNS00417.1 hypothetical protein SAMN04488503_2293 [Humidesulfovibrio mexicanus]